MDANKRQKLIDISYEIPPSCGTCKHFRSYVDPDFGDCDAHTYVHLKHSGGKRRLSVVRYGKCDTYTPSEDIQYLHGYMEFLVDKPG